MNRTFYTILIISFAIAVSAAFGVSSIRIGATDRVETVRTTEEIVWSKVSLVSLWGWLNDTKTEKIENIQGQRISKDTPILIDFWRLSSFLYNSVSGSQSWVLQKVGSGIILWEVSWIVSLYDLFMMYTIFDSKDRFRLDQITNGSIYIWKEKDEDGTQKISVYAIDGVVRLTFLSDKQEMTSLLLFPWSYIRFDPSRNRSLKWADLFRTILSLKETENEVYEFVNPRVNIGLEDTFFNYRLSGEQNKTLFKILSAQSRKKVETINLKKSYNPYSSKSTSQSTWLINPSKKNHNMLLRLSELLTQVISQQDTQKQITEISKIYNQAKNLKLKDATAKWLVEQFLLDGRFAVYGWAATDKYQDTYEEIAKMIGIHATAGQNRLLQSLADIYSRNLFTQKRNEKSMLIDTYAPTANELTKTLDQNDVAPKDYFDIAIYALNILRKMEKSPQLLLESAMEDTATYSYLVTFFRASNLYMESITDAVKKQQTIMSFARQFYDYVLGMIVNSLYQQFTIVQDKALYLAPDYQEGIKVTISDEMMSAIERLKGSVEYMTPSIEALWSWSGQSDEDTYERIHKNIIRMRSFMEMIDPDGYKSYTEAPYQYDDVAWEKWLILPLFSEEGDTIIRLDKKMVEKLRNEKIITTDPRIAELKKIWPNADASNWWIEDDNIRIVDAPYQVARESGETTELLVTFLYKDKTFNDGVIKYWDYVIRVYVPAGEFLTIPQLYAFLADIQYYLDTIDARLENYNGEVWEMRIFPMKQRVNIGDSLYTVLIP